jgi:hypothetical protein
MGGSLEKAQREMRVWMGWRLKRREGEGYISFLSWRGEGL